MKRLVHTIEHEFENLHGLYPNSADIADTQRALVENKIATIPNSFIDFLESINGINYKGGEIFGINPPSNLAGDILDINLKQERFIKSKYIILGVDDFDYLVYNQEKSLYQIIDKSDLEVLEEYPEAERAISYILKV
ncbi:MAG: hypothetical protein LBR70_03255 [Lactobacillaceae bacterium]|jgi:hypothetical protein|nr:hypothetical protein [Lactobacillaceae bacterium]